MNRQQKIGVGLLLACAVVTPFLSGLAALYGAAACVSFALHLLLLPLSQNNLLGFMGLFGLSLATIFTAGMGSSMALTAGIVWLSLFSIQVVPATSENTTPLVTSKKVVSPVWKGKTADVIQMAVVGDLTRMAFAIQSPHCTENAKNDALMAAARAGKVEIVRLFAKKEMGFSVMKNALLSLIDGCRTIVQKGMAKKFLDDLGFDVLDLSEQPTVQSLKQVVEEGFLSNSSILGQKVMDKLLQERVKLLVDARETPHIVSGGESAYDTGLAVKLENVFNNKIKTDPDLNKMLKARGGFLGVEKEIKDYLLNEMSARLSDQLKQAKKTGKTSFRDEPRAREIISCIQNNKQGLINGDENALGKLRVLVAKNNSLDPIIAWRAYDPGSTIYNGYPNYFTLGSTSILRIDTYALTRQMAVYYYLIAVTDNNVHRFDKYVAECRRGNNRDSDRSEAMAGDKVSCETGNKTRLIHIIQGTKYVASLTQDLKEYIHKKILDALNAKFQDSGLSKSEKTALYNAVMFFPNTTMEQFIDKDYSLLRNENGGSDSENTIGVIQLLGLRNNFITEVFGDSFRDNIRNYSNFQEASAEEIDYYLTRLTFNIAQAEAITNIYNRYVDNVPANSQSASQNPFTDLNWDIYSDKQQISGKPVALQQMLTSRFVAGKLEYALFDALSAAKRKPVPGKTLEEFVRDAVLDFKVLSTTAPFQRENLGVLQTSLLAAHGLPPVSPIHFGGGAAKTGMNLLSVAPPGPNLVV